MHHPMTRAALAVHRAGLFIKMHLLAAQAAQCRRRRQSRQTGTDHRDAAVRGELALALQRLDQVDGAILLGRKAYALGKRPDEEAVGA